jgi:hypothetical protein
MTRRRCLDCQDGRHCRQRGYVPAGMVLAACRCLDCDPQPIQARLFSHVLVENDLGGCPDCSQPATQLLVGGAGQSDTSLCEACGHRRYLAATGGRDLASEERARWGQPPIPGLSREGAASRFCSRRLMLGRFVARNDTETPAGHPGRRP